MTQLKAYPVWDASVRWFHWINVLCVLGLIAIGVAILNDKALGVSNDGKVLLKTVHVWIGYVFALNLLWRLVWAFVGGVHSRWRAILPGGRGYLSETSSYLSDFRAGRTRQYLGHNPLGRIAVTLLLLLLLAQATTGLILAGTDLFYPPIGSRIANWVAAPGIDPATLVPYAPTMYDKDAYAAMRSFRETHCCRSLLWLLCTARFGVYSYRGRGGNRIARRRQFDLGDVHGEEDTEHAACGSEGRRIEARLVQDRSAPYASIP